jgi:hypothetical protein
VTELLIAQYKGATHRMWISDMTKTLQAFRKEVCTIEMVWRLLI